MIPGFLERTRPAALGTFALLIAILSGFSAGFAQSGTVPQAGVGADEWAARARSALAGGSVFEAIEAFDHALAVEPGRSDLRLEYADLLKSSGYWLRSAAQYKGVLQAAPTDGHALIGYAELLNAEYQFAAAAEQFTRALQAGGLDVHQRERAQVGLGSAKFGLEDFAASARIFDALLKERPRVATAMAFLAISRRRLGELDAAEALWDRYLELDPQAAPARIHKIEVQELKGAIADARKAVQDDPSRPGVWAALGRLLRRQPDLPGAAEAFAAAVKLSPSDPSLHLARGLVLRDLGRWKEAAASFAGVGTHPRLGGMALYNLAFCARRARDHRLEVRAWADAVALHPGDLYAYRRYVAALKRHGGLELERARLLHPPGGEPAGGSAVRRLARLALAEEASGNKEAARAAAIDAVRADPNDVHAQRLIRDLLSLDARALEAATRDGGAAGEARRRGAVLLALGRVQEARPSLERALQEEPEDPSLLVAVAACARDAGEAAEAIRLLEKAGALDPSSFYAHLDLALAYGAAGRVQDAVEAAERAARIDPAMPAAWSILGTALKQAGRLDQAAGALEQAIHLDPMDDVAAPRLLLAKVKGEMGRMEEARELLPGDAPQEPEEIYRLAWEFVRDTYHDRTFRGQDWSAWRHRFDGQLKTTPEALGAIALMISSLDDRNTRLRSPDQTARLMFTHRSDAPQFSASGAALGTSRTVAAQRLPDNLGYIAVTNMDDPRSHAEIRKAVEEMKTADGVILDLRGNQGGSDAEVARIAGMFVPAQTVTGATVGPEGRTPERPVPPGPGGGPIIPQNKPVVVLVDRNTASSAESLAGSLKEANRAILVGEKTFGKSGIQVPKLLPGGAVVLVVGAEHADRSGAVYTGRGIEPDVRVEGASLPERGADDPAVSKARDLLRRRKGGR
ncbi:MAG TPA: S41 family peptidase [Candidatus Polarisedimenticolia bacterium]|nr:S41 family peptidase [Candidatus Polarisedimenticolia bacterium]